MIKYKFRTQYNDELQEKTSPETAGNYPSVVEPGAKGVSIPAMLDLFEKTKDLNILGLGSGVQKPMSEEEQQEFLRSESALDDPIADAIDVFEELQEQQGFDSQVGQIQVPSDTPSPSAEQNIAQQSTGVDAVAKGFEQGSVRAPNDD